MMLTKTLNAIDNLSVWIGKMVSWLCLIMIFVLLYEIASRYLANSPTEWAHETTTMLYGTFCIIGAVWTHKEKGHVRSEVVYQIMPPKLQVFFDVLTGVIVLVMLSIFFVAAYEYAAESWQSREISSKSTWGVPVYPFKSVIPVAVVLMFIQQLTHTIRDIAHLSGHKLKNTDSPLDS